MSLNQLVDPLVPLDIKVNDLDVLGNIAIAGSLAIEGDLTVAGEVKALEYKCQTFQDRTVVMNSGAFAGQSAYVQAQRFGEYALIDVAEHFGTTVAGNAVIQGALLPGFRPPEPVTMQLPFVNKSGTGAMAIIEIESNGNITIAPLAVSGAGVVSSPWVLSGAESGWYGFSFLVWIEPQTGQGVTRSVRPSGAPRPLGF
jgi:hypothetical protein